MTCHTETILFIDASNALNSLAIQGTQLRTLLNIQKLAMPSIFHTTVLINTYQSPVDLFADGKSFFFQLTEQLK